MKKILVGGLVIPVLIISFGLGLILYPKISDWRYGLFQAELETKAQAKVRESNTGGMALPDGVIGKLAIPKIGLETYVLSGTTPQVLNQGPGHYEETPPPGAKGNCAIAGHRTMYGHPFRYLDQLEGGDKVIIYTTSRQCTYRVIEKKNVQPTNLSVVAPTEGSRLTLTTCAPVGSARQRLVIVAELIDD